LVSTIPQHWFGDHDPVRIDWSDACGRFAVANRRVAAGETVLRTTPYAAAVYDVLFAKICQRCFTHRPGLLTLAVPCAGCSATWYCSQDCRSSDEPLHAIECAPLGRALEDIGTSYDVDQRTEIRLVLRILSRAMLEWRDPARLQPPDATPARWTFSDYLLLSDGRARLPSRILRALHPLAEHLFALGPWRTVSDAGQILNVLLKARENTFTIPLARSVSAGSGVYLDASLFNHSCQPTLGIFPVPGSSALEFVALDDLAEGDMFTLDYVGYGDLRERRTYLIDSFGFLCDCHRCRREEQGDTAGHEMWRAERSCAKPDCPGFAVPRPPRDGGFGAPARVCNLCLLEDLPPS
jgi:hypothetical protein